MSTSEVETRAALREWILERNPGVDPASIGDGTPLIERRYLTSLQVADLLLFIEELRRDSVDPRALKVGVFRSIDAMYAAFFATAAAP